MNRASQKTLPLVCIVLRSACCVAAKAQSMPVAACMLRCKHIIFLLQSYTLSQNSRPSPLVLDDTYKIYELNMLSPWLCRWAGANAVRHSCPASVMRPAAAAAVLARTPLQTASTPASNRCDCCLQEMSNFCLSCTSTSP